VINDPKKMRTTVSESASSSDRHEVSSAAPPYVDCIQWVPRRFSGGASPSTIADLVFTQSALEAVHSSIAAAPASPVFGALIGSVFEDPTCARRWVRVERVVSGPSVAEDATVDELAQAILGIGSVDSPASVVGWYRSHHQAGLYLSPEEAEFHEQRFPAPWALALIVAGTGDRLAGGVFQRTDPEGLSRSVYTPFYELTDETARVSGNTRRTTVAWTNYQTEARVVRPGEPESPTVMTMPGLPQASPEPAPAGLAGDTADAAAQLRVVEDEAPPTEAPPAVLSEAEAGAAENVSPAVAGLPLLSPTPVTPSEPSEPSADELAEAESQREAEAEWEKVQIQRSLMAVGRSLGPSTISELGAPAPETPVERPQEPPVADNKPESVPPEPMATPRPDLRVIDGQGNSSEPAVSDGIIPITGGVPISDAGGLVGRSRRRRRQIPVARIAMAACGVTLMLTAGWVGTQTLGARGAGVADGGDGSGESAVAGLSLAPGDMFAENERDESESPVDPEIDTNQAADPTSNADTQASQTGQQRPGETFEELSPLTVVVDSGTEYESVQNTATANDGDAPPIEAPLPPEVVEAPVLDSLEIVDPTVSAYETALTIFRAEVERYEEVRREFDEGLMTCNPLNLAFRGALETYGRLERRHADIQPGLTGARARAHAAAGRQYAVTRTHYELTDCPMPVGG
jgi:hypothetical protein